MSKRRKQADTAAADRATRYRAIVAELSIQSGRPKDDLRVIDAAWARLASENMREQIIQGLPIDIVDLERAAAALNSILPPRPTDLNVHFVDHSDVCIICRGPLPPVEERQPEAAKPSPTDTSANAPATVLEAASNVTPLRPKPEQSPKSDTAIAEWVDISGTGRVQGQEPAYSLPARPRFFGDIPDGF